MYLFLPLINKGILYLNKTELEAIIVTTLGIFIIWKDFMNYKFDTFKVSSGYSVLWLLNFYIVGAYLEKYIINIKRRKIVFCIKCIFIYLCTSLLTYYLGIYKGINKLIIIKEIKHIFCYRINSLAMIIQSISLTLFFSQINFNETTSKIISFLGKLTFGIYLIHQHEFVKKILIIKLFKKYSINLSLKYLIILIIINSLYIFIICAFIDYLRNLIFQLLKIRQLCIFFERFFKEFFLK